MVLVVIKAANGAVDDFRVNGAESGWTVSELKNYLYRHYPTHPVCTCIVCGLVVQRYTAFLSTVRTGAESWERPTTA